MLKSFLVARTKEPEYVMVMFKEPFDIITLPKEEFFAELFKIARRQNTILPAYPENSALTEVTGVIVMSAAASDVNAIRAALKKLEREKKKAEKKAKDADGS